MEDIHRKIRFTSRSLWTLLIATPGLLSTGSSCKDKTPPKEPDYCVKHPDLCEPITAAKDYFLFKPGSWWVYEEETTHERDSVYVTEYANDPESANFDCRLYSQREDYFYHYYPIISSGPGCSNEGLSGNKCIYIERAKTRPGNFIGDDHCFFIQYKIGAEVPTSNTVYWDDVISVEGVYDQYSSPFLTFGRTIKIHEGHTYIEANSPTYHYFSRGVGLIRKEIIDSNQTWNLVNYHIEP